MASVKSVDEASVEKKLNGAKNTQESIQSLCLWALHHKAQHDNIVKIWLNILKKSKIPRRLTLFYLCNEIVQTCKRKHAIMYKDAFKEVLRDAVLLVRDNSVRNNIERIFGIWEERNIYDSEFIEDLMAILNNTKIRPSAAKLLAEYKPSKLRENIGKIVKLQKETEGKRRRMASLNIDVTSQNYLKLLKDRSHGKQCTQQIEDLHHYLEEYVSNLEKEMKERQAQQELLEQSELFYDAQYGEAKIVTNAYKNFGTRVTNLQKKLDDIRKTLPDPLSPIPSPTVDAPSPVESVAEATEDNNETVDMEMSDVEDNDGCGEHKAYSPSNVASSTPPSQPTYSTVDNLTLSPSKEMPGKSVSLPAAAKSSDSLPDSPVATDAIAAIDYNSSFLSRLPTGGLPSFSLQFNNNSSSQTVRPSLDAGFTNDESSSTAADDEGGGTPVQDEKPETTKPVVDPVALLNQLLSCTKKSSDGTDFLKSLSVLTQSMNVPFKPPAEDEKVKKQQIDDDDGIVTSLHSSSTEEKQPPQFQPFYHAKDYLEAEPQSTHVNSGSSGQTIKQKSVIDTSCLSLPKTGSTESDAKTILPPPPLPPAFNFSSMGFRAMRPFEPPEDLGSEAAVTALKTESNGKPVNMGGEGILNMRPDLVEMLKNVLNTTKSTSSALGQGIPDVLDPGPPAPTPPLQALNIPVVPSTGYEFSSNEVNGEYVESLKRNSGFSSLSDPFASSQNFHDYTNAGRQRVSSTFPTENKFQGPNWDEHNMQGHLEPHFMQSKGDHMSMVYDGYESQGLATHSFPIQSQVRTPMQESHPIPPLLSSRNLPEFASPDMPHRGFGPDYSNSDRNSGDGLQVYDIRPGLNRFPEPSYFDVRPRFPTEFNQGNPPTRHFGGGPQLRLPPLRPPPRFLPRGFYPPY